MHWKASTRRAERGRIARHWWGWIFSSRPRLHLHSRVLQDTYICPLPYKQIAREAALALPTTPARALQYKQLRRGAQGCPRGSSSTRRGSRPRSWWPRRQTSSPRGQEGRVVSIQPCFARLEKRGRASRSDRRGERWRWGQHEGSKGAPSLHPRWAALLPAVNTTSPDNPQAPVHGSCSPAMGLQAELLS